MRKMDETPPYNGDDPAELAFVADVGLCWGWGKAGGLGNDEGPPLVASAGTEFAPAALNGPPPRPLALIPRPPAPFAPCPVPTGALFALNNVIPPLLPVNPPLPPLLTALPSDSELGNGFAPTLLKKRHNSSCVASLGTFPTHITHSERCVGGLGWYDLRPGRSA
ncbi:hypothetical protein EUX98_g4152 [Antrodiella citrinella]|uniref:Uncharacterized protein n=1 Tax=Antrodiella citrinella TaxID=2447956 RepID=A0A4S4MX84_9APHY|nr:hypothetical protein EUX98_g4152 [Antrodiella citrinella]